MAMYVVTRVTIKGPHGEQHYDIDIASDIPLHTQEFKEGLLRALKPEIGYALDPNGYRLERHGTFAEPHLILIMI